MKVERFTSAVRGAWDDFVGRSRNGTFLFFRDYMEYHRDRFEDHSLIVRDDRDRWLAVLPANRRGTTLASHGGLTYGGVVSQASMTVARMAEVFDVLVEHLRREAFTTLRYRAVPHIYHRVPCEEDLYVLQRLGARLVHRAVLSVVDARGRVAAQERRRRGVRRARAAGLTCREGDELAEYWALLSKALRTTYGADPVHSLDEISSLWRRFPENIRLFGCYRGGANMVAGALVYETVPVARAQYIAASEEGKQLAALDLLFEHLLGEVFAGKRFFDLGTSESGNDGLNRGVLEFKESLGARTVVQDTYELPLSSAA